MKFQFALLALFFLMSCKPQKFSGQMQNATDLTFGNVTIEAGVWDASLSIEGKRTLKIVVPYDSYPREAKIETKKEIKKYISNGDIFIPASENDQGYKVEGKIDSLVELGQLQRDYERCTYEEPRTVCHTDARGHTTCHTEYRTQWGYRDVEFKEQKTTSELQVSLVNTKSNGIGGFKGTHIKKERLYQYQGFCR